VAPRGAPRYDGSLGPAHEERWAVSMTVVGDAERGENRGGGEFTMEEALPRGGGGGRTNGQGNYRRSGGVVGTSPVG
jgi:hypothetical protein